MSLEYDKPRNAEDVIAEEPLEKLITRRAERTAVEEQDGDEPEFGHTFVAALDDSSLDVPVEEFTVRVVPVRTNEFNCARCHLVYHRQHMAAQSGDAEVCADCA
jgi:hypothetical protein